MKTRHKLIASIEERIGKNEELLSNLYVSLGRLVVESGKEAARGGAIPGLLTEIAEAKKNAEAAAHMGARIEEIVVKAADIRKALIRLEDEADEREKRNIPAYEEFGKAQVNRETQSLPPSAQEAALAVKKLLREIEEADEKVSGIKDSAKEKPFLSKMFEGSKALFLASSRNFKKRSLSRQYQIFGKALLESLQAVPDDEYLASYRENTRKAREAEAEVDRLTGEEAALERELQSLGVEKRFQRRLKDLEIQNEECTARLVELLKNAGREFYEKNKARGLTDEGKTLAVDIEAALRRGGEYAAEKKKLLAAIECDNLAQKLHDLKMEMEHEENEVITHRNNVETLRNIIAETEKERLRCEKESREGEELQNYGGDSKKY